MRDETEAAQVAAAIQAAEDRGDYDSAERLRALFDVDEDEPVTDGGFDISLKELEKRKNSRSTTPEDQRQRCPNCHSTALSTSQNGVYCTNCRTVSEDPLEPGDDDYPELATDGGHREFTAFCNDCEFEEQFDSRDEAAQEAYDHAAEYPGHTTSYREGRLVTDGGEDVDYWVPKSGRGGGSDRCLHPDQDCRFLNRSSTVRPAHETEVERLEVCGHCDGGHEPSEPDWSAYRAAKAAGEAEDEELVTDGGEERCPNCGGELRRTGNPTPGNAPEKKCDACGWLNHYHRPAHTGPLYDEDDLVTDGGQPEAIGALGDVVETLESIDWSTVHGMTGSEAGALTSRLEDARRETKIANIPEEELVTDGGHYDVDGEADRYPAERQADALERIADELEWQSAVLTELTYAQHLTAVSANEYSDPEEGSEQAPQSLRSLLGRISDQQHEREHAADEVGGPL